MHVNLGDQMRDDRKVEGFRHAGDLHPLRDATDAHQINHDNVDRASLQHLAEGRYTVNVFAASDRRLELGGNAGDAGIVVACCDILQPVQVIGLDALANAEGLEHVPALVDVAHEADVGPDG